MFLHLRFGSKCITLVSSEIPSMTASVVVAKAKEEMALAMVVADKGDGAEAGADRATDRQLPV